MREQCIPNLVESWFQILQAYQQTQPEITCQCLEVVGSYVSWIDLNLIANDRWVGPSLNPGRHWFNVAGGQVEPLRDSSSQQKRSRGTTTYEVNAQTLIDAHFSMVKQVHHSLEMFERSR